MGTSGRLRHAAAAGRQKREMALAASLQLSDGQIPRYRPAISMFVSSELEGIQPRDIRRYQISALSRYDTIDALDVFKLDFVFG